MLLSDTGNTDYFYSNVRERETEKEDLFKIEYSNAFTKMYKNCTKKKLLYNITVALFFCKCKGAIN